MPNGHDGNHACWERISQADRKPTEVAPGLLASRAASTRAIQREDGVLKRFFARSTARQITMPDGQRAQPQGERRTDVVMIWSADGEPAIGSDRALALWPSAERITSIGQNLVVAYGVKQPFSSTDPTSNTTLTEAYAVEMQAPRDGAEECSQVMAAMREMSWTQSVASDSFNSAPRRR